jgi:hypothetical protein
MGGDKGSVAEMKSREVLKRYLAWWKSKHIPKGG